MSQALNAPKVKLVPWWLVLIEGILLIIIGIFLLTNPAATFVTVIWVLGIYWLVSGVFNIIKIFFDSSMWGWKLFAGIVGILAGWFLIQNPIGGSVVVASTTVILLGLFGIFIGIVNIIQAFRGGGWGTGILGVISIILGFLLLANRFVFTFSLPWTLGILAIIGGIIAIFNAFRLRSVKKDLEEAAEVASARVAKMADTAASRTAAAGAATVGAVGAAAATAGDMAEEAIDTTAEAVGDAAEAVVDTADDVADATVAAGAATAAAVSRAAGDAGEALEDMAEAGARMVGIDLDFDPEEAEKLRQAGIERAGTLLERGAARQGRVELAKELGVEESTVLKWVNRLDLARVKGIGIKYANLLEEAGVDTVVELAQRNPQNLFKKLVEVNEELGLVEALPSEEEVAEWVAQAKELPRVISY